MGPRIKDLVGQVLTNKDGSPLQGTMVFATPAPHCVSGTRDIIIEFLDGKIHGTPAIRFSDGQQEDWENGNFIKVVHPPYNKAKCVKADIKKMKDYLRQQKEWAKEKEPKRFT
ncbi:MAG: hypothetical protein LBI28_00220 [Treponema sp.]|nr:hypothetical protein [Treponema sp.]